MKGNYSYHLLRMFWIMTASVIPTLSWPEESFSKAVRCTVRTLDVAGSARLSNARIQRTTISIISQDGKGVLISGGSPREWVSE